MYVFLTLFLQHSYEQYPQHQAFIDVQDGEKLTPLIGIYMSQFDIGIENFVVEPFGVQLREFLPRLWAAVARPNVDNYKHLKLYASWSMVWLMLLLDVIWSIIVSIFFYIFYCRRHNSGTPQNFPKSLLDVKI